MEKRSAGLITEYRHYIKVGNQPVALYTRPSSGPTTTRYFLLDHLGSVAEITTDTGALHVAESFAAFGGRRDPTDWDGPPGAGDEALIAATTPRAYTFHTNLESSPLIHMNGRVMDSLIGRFLSADPYIPQPNLTQSYNRYSYVRNNPLTYTDPSGFCGELVTFDVCVGLISSGIAVLGDMLFGKSGSRLPPPDYCNQAGPRGCYGIGPSIFEKIANDIFGPPPAGMGGWGINQDRFGTGVCSFHPHCMSLDKDNSLSSVWSSRRVTIGVIVGATVFTGSTESIGVGFDLWGFAGLEAKEYRVFGLPLIRIPVKLGFVKGKTVSKGDGASTEMFGSDIDADATLVIVNTPMDRLNDLTIVDIGLPAVSGRIFVDPITLEPLGVGYGLKKYDFGGGIVFTEGGGSIDDEYIWPRD